MIPNRQLTADDVLLYAPFDVTPRRHPALHL